MAWNGLVREGAGACCRLICLQGQQRHLLHGTTLALGALGKEKDGKEHRESETHEDSDGKDFHVTASEALACMTCSPAFAVGCPYLVDLACTRLPQTYAAVSMQKAAILETFILQLRTELQSLTRAAQDAFAAATDPDSKAENKYDTRTLEASYVARGQAQRVAELQQAVASFEGLSHAPVQPGSPIALGSIVTLQSADEAMHCLVAPFAGGTEIVVEGQKIVAITPASSMGRCIWGRRLHEPMTLPSGMKVKIVGHQ